MTNVHKGVGALLTGLAAALLIGALATANAQRSRTSAPTPASRNTSISSKT
jgi:hypothetical protein